MKLKPKIKVKRGKFSFATRLNGLCTLFLEEEFNTLKTYQLELIKFMEKPQINEDGSKMNDKDKVLLIKQKQSIFEEIIRVQAFLRSWGYQYKEVYTHIIINN